MSGWLSHRRLVGCSLGLVGTQLASAWVHAAAAVAAEDAGLEFLQPPGSERWIPFRIKANRIILDGGLNDQPVEVVLDSGVGKTTMDAAAASGFGLRPRSTLIETGVTGEKLAALTGPARLDLPGLGLSLAGVVLVDLSALSLTGRESPVVVLGQDLLDHVALHLDFHTSRVRITRPSPAPPDPG